MLDTRQVSGVSSEKGPLKYLYLEQQQSEALDLNTKAGQYKKLESEYEQTSRLCGVLDSRLKEVSIGEKLGAYDVTVVEPARAMAAPSTP